MTNFVSLILFYFFHFGKIAKFVCLRDYSLCVTCKREALRAWHQQKKVDAERVGWTHTCVSPEGVYQISFKMIMKTAFGKGSHGSRWKEVHTDMNIYCSKHTDTIHTIVSSGTWHMSVHDGTQLGRGWNPSRAKQLQVQTLVVMSAVNSTSTRVCCKLLGVIPELMVNTIFCTCHRDRQKTCGGVVYDCGELLPHTNHNKSVSWTGFDG